MNIPDEVLDQVEQALNPFDEAWKHACKVMDFSAGTMGDAGALAAHQTAGVNFRSASFALTALRKARESGDEN